MKEKTPTKKPIETADAVEEALARVIEESERQQRLYEAILASTPDLVYVIDLNYRFTYANQALLQMWGRSLEESVGRSLIELGYEPWHAEMHEREIDQVVATKQPIRGEVSFPHATFGTRIYDYIFVPVFNAQGEVETIAGTTRDVTERKRMEEALRHSEARFRAFVNASSDVVYRMNSDWSEMRYLSGREFIEDTPDPNRSWVQKYIHVDDQPMVLQAITEAVHTKSRFELEHRVLRLDGTLGWTYSRAIPMLDDDGNIVEWFGAASDVTGRKREEDQRKLLLDELNHRVKNTLSTVQSIAMQTMRSTASPAEFNTAFGSRLLALSRAHDLLTRGNWEGIDLREIIDQTLLPYWEGDRRERVNVEGTSILLRPNAAVMLNLVLHELATNAAKYGAFSMPTGQVSVDLRTTGRTQAEILWTEDRGPSIRPPDRKGFGTRLIERGVTQELEGEVALEFPPVGLRCRICFPLKGNVVAHE